ncbi:MAG: amidohydrolase [Chloroflexi bacterium]|nr:amidohydrolase [Chloroflexota bacterium]
MANSAANRSEAWNIIRGNLDRACELIDGAINWGGRDIKLLLFPEFAFQGFPYRESAQEWIDKACHDLPGDISRPLQDKAREYGVYIGANHYESDPEWPGRYFNCSFLIDPAGEVILKYRRINSAQTPSPHDFMDAYFERYGIEGTFPVADTPLGKLAMMPCGEIMFPEAARMFMMRGAEVLLQPTSDAGGPEHSAWESAKTVRAAENMMYLVSANSCGTAGSNIAADNQGGNSRIIDYEGRTLAYGGPGESTRASAMIDVEALRQARRTTGSQNRLLRSRFEIYRPLYEQTVFYPANAFATAPMPHRSAIIDVQQQALRNMIERGVTVPSPPE